MQLLIGGVDKTGLYVPKTLNITDNLNARTTCSFSLVDKTGTYHPEVGEEVLIYNQGNLIFGGTVDEPEEENPLGTDALIIPVQTVDWHEKADRLIVAEEYNEEHAGDIVRDIIAKKLAAEGITEGVIQDGPVISKAIFPYIPASQCFDELCELTGYQWLIKPDKTLDFFERSTNIAPWGIIETSPVKDIRVRRNREQFRNRQYLRAGKDISTVQTREFVGDGKTQVWAVDLPIAKVPVVKVNGVAQTVGIRGLDKETTPIEPFTHTDTTKADFEAGELDGVVATDDGVELEGEKGLEFDGVDDYVSLGTASELSLRGKSDFTIECKVTPLTVGGSRQAIWGDISGSPQWGLMIETSGVVRWFHYNGSNIQVLSNTQLTEGISYHIAVTGSATSGKVTLLINGEVENTATSVLPVSGRDLHDLRLGNYASDTYGNIIPSEARLWNITRSQEDIQSTMESELTGNETGLVGYWKIDEGTGLTIYDSAGDNDGTIYGATWFAEYEPQGTLTKEIDISTEAAVEATKIEWTATTPTDTSVTIETALSLDGGESYGEWQTATNGSAIPDITAETDLSNARLKYRATLETQDTSVTPILHSVTVSVYPRFIGWYWQKGDKEISQNTMSEPLSNADTLTIEYQGYYPIMVLAEDGASINERKAIEGGTGVYEHVEERRQIDTQAAALESAQGLLRRYARINKVMTFNTYKPGLRPGQLIHVNLPIHNINESLLISRITITDPGREDGRLLYSVECLSGEAVGGWVQFFKKLVDQGKTFVIRENEILISLLTYRDSFIVPAMEDEMAYVLHQYPICGQMVCGAGVNII